MRPTTGRRAFTPPPSTTLTGAAATWSTGSVTGLDNVDMWIGGLAEKQSLFGGVLGSTFEYVFRTQMEALQDGDRLYYLPRIEGTDYEESLQDSSLAQLIRANTGIKHLPGNIFLTPEYTVEASTYFNADGSVKDTAGARQTWLQNPLTGKLLVNIDRRRNSAVRRRRQLPRQHHRAGRHRGK